MITPPRILNSIALVSAAALCGVLWSLHQSTPCLAAFLWDPASHALDGLKLYNNFITLSPISFWLNLTQMVHWPPLPPLLMFPFYLVMGPTPDAPALFSLACFFILLVMQGWFLFHNENEVNWRGGLAGWVTLLALVICSPMLQRYSILVMYEMSGALFTFWALISYWRFKNTDRLWFFQQTCVALTCCLLLKWNYGLQLLTFVGALELGSSDSIDRRRLWNQLVAPILDPRWQKWTGGLMVILACLSLWIAMTGGWAGELLGHRVSMTRLGNPLYGLFLCLAIRLFSRVAQQTIPLRTLARTHYWLIHLTVIPYTCWLVYPHPNRIKGLLYHLNYGAKDPPSRFSWGVFNYYFEQLSEHYLVSVIQLWWVLVGLLGVGVTAYVTKNRGLKITCGYLVYVWFSSTYFTSNHEARFFLHAVPVLFFVLAYAVAVWSSKKAYFGLVALVFVYFPSQHWQQIRDFYRGEPGPSDGWHATADWCYGNEEMLSTIRREIVDRIEGEMRFATFGISDMSALCPLISWELHRKNPYYSRWPLPKTCDYGYQVTAEQHLQRNLASLKWILRVEPVSGPSPNQSVKKLLKEAGAEKWKRFQVELPQRGYRGMLYRVGSQERE